MEPVHGLTPWSERWTVPVIRRPRGVRPWVGHHTDRDRCLRLTDLTAEVCWMAVGRRQHSTVVALLCAGAWSSSSTTLIWRTAAGRCPAAGFPPSAHAAPRAGFARQHNAVVSLLCAAAWSSSSATRPFPAISFSQTLRCREQTDPLALDRPLNNSILAAGGPWTCWLRCG